MVERGLDQADGLRRMFSESRPRVIEIVSGHVGVGRTAVSVNLGVALARRGRNTLLVDHAASLGEGRALRYFGGEPAQSDRGHEPHAIGIPGVGGFAVLELVRGPWRRAVRAPSAGTGVPAALLREAASRDCILVSSTTTEPVLLCEHGRREVLVILSQAAASITGAYALIKRMVHDAGSCRFRVVVNRVDSDAAALHIFRNMARVAEGYLDVRLEMLGFIPADPCVERAAIQGRSVIECSPEAPSTRAFCQLAEAIGRDPGTKPRPRPGTGTPSAPLRLAI